MRRNFREVYMSDEKCIIIGYIRRFQNKVYSGIDDLSYQSCDLFFIKSEIVFSRMIPAIVTIHGTLYKFSPTFWYIISR